MFIVSALSAHETVIFYIAVGRRRWDNIPDWQINITFAVQETGQRLTIRYSGTGWKTDRDSNRLDTSKWLEVTADARVDFG